MLGLTDVLNNLVQSLRVRELDLSKKFRKLMCWRVLFRRFTNDFRYAKPLTSPSRK